jgi:hypothetical protein
VSENRELYRTRVGVIGGPVPRLDSDWEEWPLRHVVVFCDRCGHELDADVHADSGSEAIDKLRAHATSELGWRAGREDVCASCIKNDNDPKEGK